MVVTVTGSTGTIGRELIRLLSGAGTPTRAVFRNPNKIPARPNLVWAQIEALLALAAYQKAGGPTSAVSDTVARILGRPPRTIRDFARDHADRFSSPEAFV